MKRQYHRRRPAPVLTPLSQTQRDMIVSQDEFETRIAFLEEGRLAEYYYERNEESSIVGNIYKGKVTAVLPGLQAAFVDIGLEKSGFLHVRDVMTESMTVEDYMSAKEARKREESEDAEAEGEGDRQASSGRGPRRPIQELLKKGQDILVQVEKEPISTKGSRLTGQISMPSRLVVLIPGVQHTGVSHRIADDKERSRLKKILDRVTPKGFSAIARTSAVGAEEEDLKADINYLVKLWKKIKLQEKKSHAPAVLHSEQGLLNRVARDLLTKEDRHIIVDAPKHDKKIKQYLQSFLGSLKPDIEIYEGKVPLFESLNLDYEVERALRPKVWLKCGGYLVIEETEALVVVDVNTGRNVGKAQQDETILRTNLEAAQEIGRQLRLRDLGGIIVLDFIDMRPVGHKEKVFNELAKALRRDRAKTSIRKLTDLGIIEMTRKRVRGSLLRLMCEACPACQGRGWVPSQETMRLKFFRTLERARRVTDEKEFILEISPFWVTHLGENVFRQQARDANVRLQVTVNKDLKTEELRLLSAQTKLVLAGGEKEA